jgi:hypothetical protein
MFSWASFLSLRASGNDTVRQTCLPIASFVLIACLVLSTHCLPGTSVHAAPTPLTTISSTSLSGLISRDVSFLGGDGIPLYGTILELPTAKPGRAGIVLVHGSGVGLRTNLLGEATAFAQQGLSVLIYDKRSVGYSIFQRSYSLLADDALGAVHTLRAHAGVDPTKVGIWGLSEGGWVAPLAASRSVNIAFVIVVGANAIEPLRQQTWALTSTLRRESLSGSLIEQAIPNMYRLWADIGMFAEAYYDGEAVLRHVRQPLLGIWGGHDLLTPPQENPPRFAHALEQGGNTHYTFRFFPEADHAAHQTIDGGQTRLPSLTPGYAELVGSWVHDVTSGWLPVADVAPTPPQDWLSTPVPRSSWWESAWMHLIVFVLLLAAFSAYPLVALVRRMRGSSPQAPVGCSARLLAAVGTVTVLGFFVYLMYLLMSTRTVAAPGPILAGRPLAWLLLQALALVTTGAMVAMIAFWYRRRSLVRRGEQIRLGLLLTGGVLFLPWALYWGLLFP